MLSCGAASAHAIAAFCWRIMRHNTLAALADLYPQWLIRDLLPLPPSDGIPREATRSLSPPSFAALRAKAAGRSLQRSKIAIKAAMVAGLDTATGDHHGSDWQLHPRRRWILQRHHQDALAQHQSALPAGRTVREREGSKPSRDGRQRRDRCRVAAKLQGQHRLSLGEARRPVLPGTDLRQPRRGR